MAYNEQKTRVWDRTTPNDGLLLEEEFNRLYENFREFLLRGNFRISRADAGASSLQLANQATGQAATDGLKIEIEESGRAVINQQENQDIAIKTNASERLVITSAGIVKLDTLTERTSDNGVNIDGVNIKDGGATFTAVPTLPASDPAADNQAVRKAYVDARVPAGTILMFGGSSAPAGFFICDGTAKSRSEFAGLFAAINTTYGAGDGSITFNIPDFRGIFPRGAGTSAKLANANGTAFFGTLGSYQNDKTQGHRHVDALGINTGSGGSGYAYGVSLINIASRRSFGGTDYVGRQAYISLPLDDSSNGTPRTGTETNPANLSISFIIKY